MAKLTGFALRLVLTGKLFRSSTPVEPALSAQSTAALRSAFPRQRSDHACWRCPIAEPTCASAQTLPRTNWLSGANSPTPHDSLPIESLSNVRRHVSAHLRPNRETSLITSSASPFQTLPRVHRSPTLPTAPLQRPPLPAPSFKPPYRKCLGANSPPSASCPDAFPIQANNFSVPQRSAFSVTSTQMPGTSRCSRRTAIVTNSQGFVPRNALAITDSELVANSQGH
jgi:hypothetical protein